MNEPLVSIITPSYNQAQFIEDTILSVKQQGYPNLEHIIIDGGSTDGTLEILRRYENSYNLHWQSEPDQGQSHAINKGMKQAQGEIIGWINSDDTYLKGAISTAADFLNRHIETMWLYGDGCWIDEHNGYIREWVSRPFDLETLVLNTQYIIQPTAFYRKHILEEVGYLDTNLQLTMDFDLFVRLGCLYSPVYISRPLATRRIHASAKTASSNSNFGEDGLRTMKKLLEKDALPQEIANKKQIAFSRFHVRWGKAEFNQGRFREARRHLLEAFRLDPRIITRKTAAILVGIIQSLLRVQWIKFDQIRRSPGNRRAEEQAITWYRAHDPE